MGDGHENIRKTHAYIKRVLPIIARRFYGAATANTPIEAWLLEKIKRLAHEIEVIAPACSAGDVRFDNSEYPWLDNRDEVQTPCLYPFPNLNDGDRHVLLLIRLIRTAAKAYST